MNLVRSERGHSITKVWHNNQRFQENDAKIWMRWLCTGGGKGKERKGEKWSASRAILHMYHEARRARKPTKWIRNRRKTVHQEIFLILLLKKLST